tara:strand:+ start:259 stop:744 length:486 start_codon:yes stop_codon:yes gene_type:complete
MDNRSDKDKEFDRAQAMGRLSQDDKDKMSLIKMMMDKEKKSIKKEDMYLDDDEFEMEMVVDKAKEISPILKGIDMDTIISFVKTHRQDIRGASDDEIRDEFEEFMSVNTEYVREEDNVEVDVSDATAGDSAIERESASGAFEEAVNWRGETLKEQFKRLSK